MVAAAAAAAASQLLKQHPTLRHAYGWRRRRAWAPHPVAAAAAMVAAATFDRRRGAARIGDRVLGRERGRRHDDRPTARRPPGILTLGVASAR